MIPNIECVSTGLDDSFNEHVITKLHSSAGWALSNDARVVTQYSNEEAKEFSDSGFLMRTYDIERHADLHKRFIELNILADVIFSTVIKKLQRYDFHNIVLQRYLWNYYNRSSYGVTHWDSDESNTCSIVYYLNTCDAYTIFENQRFDCISGDSIVFNSNTVHQGTGPVIHRSKYCLNIVFKYDHVVY